MNDTARFAPDDHTGADKPQSKADTVGNSGAEATTPPSTIAASHSGGMETIPERFGRYHVVKELGRGAMGSVYLAEDTVLRRRVALKIPKFAQGENPELLERFYREARAAATLNHPNICQVYDIGEQHGIRYMTMAHISGPPLSKLVGSSELRLERTIAELVQKIALGLAAAHGKGILHRDLKPANILLDERSEPVITDFGLARLMKQDVEDRLTQEGVILGTLAYMSAEQTADAKTIGPANDVYSLGVILYELLTGELPYKGSVTSVIRQIVEGKPKPPSELCSDLDKRLETICLKMMATSVEDRYASADDAAAALDHYLKQKTPETRGATQSVDTSDRQPAQSEPTTEPAAGETVANSIGMQLVLIPAGEFLMGSPDTDSYARDSEKPQHPVRITKPFCLGIYPVTQQEYERVMGENPSKFKEDPRLPVEMVSWLNAIEFCNRLSELEGLDQYYRTDSREIAILGGEGYRLPTEAEWEYACRAGTTTRWSCGEEENILQRFARFNVNSQDKTHLVGEKDPNDWGLFDMHGNVWEWCWDWFDECYYAKSPTDDPRGPSEATLRVIRGGGWGNLARNCRAAYRDRLDPPSRWHDLGFRVAAVPPGGQDKGKQAEPGA